MVSWAASTEGWQLHIRPWWRCSAAWEPVRRPREVPGLGTTLPSHLSAMCQTRAQLLFGQQGLGTRHTVLAQCSPLLWPTTQLCCSMAESLAPSRAEAPVLACPPVPPLWAPPAPAWLLGCEHCTDKAVILEVPKVHLFCLLPSHGLRDYGKADVWDRRFLLKDSCQS